MKIEAENIDYLLKLQNNLIQRNKAERSASGSLTSETLTLLNLSMDTLPQRCQQLIQRATSLQVELDQTLDPVAISVRQSKEIAARAREEFELMELRHNNTNLQRQIDRNRIFIEELKRELQSSKESLANQNPSPDSIEEHVRQMKQKMASYEEFYEKAKIKFTKLHVPEGILPQSIDQLSSRLAALKAEEQSLQQRAEDVTLAREARDTLSKLARG